MSIVFGDARVYFIVRAPRARETLAARESRSFREVICPALSLSLPLSLSERAQFLRASERGRGACTLMRQYWRERSFAFSRAENRCFWVRSVVSGLVVSVGFSSGGWEF